MPLTKRVASVFLFPNGILVVFDANGQQIPELQGLYSIELHRRIRLEALAGCSFDGFEILPLSFEINITGWVNRFMKQNLSWDEIQAL